MGDEIQMMIAEGGFLIGRGEARGGFLVYSPRLRWGQPDALGDHRLSTEH